MSYIVLVSPPLPRIENDNLDPPLGLMYLSSALKAAGHTVKILDFAGGRQHAVPKADIYGFATYTPTYSWSLQKQAELRRTYPSAKYIAGGAHVTAMAERCATDWDCVVVGEGERAIVAIANNSITNKIIYSQPIMDVDSLPYPDYSHIDIGSYDRKLNGKRLVCIFSSRGCPYKCAFCNSVVWNGARKVRFRNPCHVATEILDTCSRFGLNHVRFVDDLFTASERRVSDMTRAIRPLDIVYRCFARCSGFTQSMADKLVESGCIQVGFGVESGSDRILRLMDKEETKEDVRNAIKHAKASGLMVRVYLIVGFPGETWDTVEETCNLMLECEPTDMMVSTPIPFPGTAIERWPRKYGITWVDSNYDNYMPLSKGGQTCYVISHTTANRDEIKAMWEYAVERLAPIKWHEGKE